MQTNLFSVLTRDKLNLGGLLFEPRRKSRTVVLWLGALSFSIMPRASKVEKLAEEFTKQGLSLAILEHRGSGVAVRLRKGLKKEQRQLGGTAYEKFTDCIFDIEAGIKFLQGQGYKKIILCGHSTGANKAAYYIQTTGGKGIVGVGLLGPLSDVPGFKNILGQKYQSTLNLAKKMVAQNRGDELLPLDLFKGILWSAQRFLSIATPSGAEDMFPYYQSKCKFTWVKKLNKPTLVLIGEKDQYADLPPAKILQIFKNQIPTEFFTGQLVAGGNHGFDDKEGELVKVVVKWIKLPKS
ncbi:MAG: DUF1749 domain-containing protein [Patescibacteria group bacterium]